MRVREILARTLCLSVRQALRACRAYSAAAARGFVFFAGEKAVLPQPAAYRLAEKTAFFTSAQAACGAGRTAGDCGGYPQAGLHFFAYAASPQGAAGPPRGGSALAYLFTSAQAACGAGRTAGGCCGRTHRQPAACCPRGGTAAGSARKTKKTDGALLRLSAALARGGAAGPLFSRRNVLNCSWAQQPLQPFSPRRSAGVFSGLFIRSSLALIRFSRLVA